MAGVINQNENKLTSNNGVLNEESFVERTPVTHGIYLQAKIASSRNIICVCHNFHSGQYLVHYEDGEMELYLSDGSHEKAESVGLFDGVVYASRSNVYIAWNKEGTLKLLSQSLEDISDVKSQSHINNVIYNEFKNEIISTASGKIHIWKFSFNNSLLVPVLIIKDCLDANIPIKVIAVEQTSSKRQRMFAAVSNGILVFRHKDGQCISKMPDLHRRDITDVIFYQPFQILLTAATDGSIKLWDNSGNLRSVFVGHISAVTCLSICQNGPLALSGSGDGSVRLWDIDANEQVECIETGEAVVGILKKLGESDFYTYSARSLSFWKLNNVYSIFTIIGSQPKILKATVNPTVPFLSYYICEDACIRFVCPKSGNILCVMMSPEWKRITDAICVPSKGKIFVLLRDGDILKCSIDQNPCKIEETWSTEHTGAKSNCTAVCLVEHIHEETLDDDEFEDGATELKESQGTKNTNKKQNAVMLIGGCEDGTLVVYNLAEGNESGKVSYSVDAHRDRVLALASSNELNQVASSSIDKSVRIWRAFPSVDNTLVPLFFILNYEPATHLVYGKSRLCVALQEPSTATYNITVFKTTDSEPERIEHTLNDDHQDSIIALCSCQKLELFASASTNGIIKVWNERNEIVGIIKLHSKPSGLCFCTEKGDLLVGIGGHVHRIPHQKYLPETLLQSMVLMQFKEQQDIPPTAVNEEVLASLSIDQKHRLQKARSSELLLAKFVDTLPQDEIEERKEEEAEKELAVSVLKKRDSDLERIRKGAPLKKKKPVAPNEVREEAWRNYIDLYYRRPPIPAIGLDDYDDDNDDDTAYKPKGTSDKFVRERGSTGFFSISTEVSDIKKITTKLREEKDDDTESFSAKAKAERSLSLESEVGFTPRETIRPLTAELELDAFNYPSESDFRRILSAPAKIRVPIFAARNRKNMVKFLKPIDVPPASDFPHNFRTIRDLNRQITADSDDRQKSFNENRRAMGMLPVAPDGYLPNSIIVALYKELEKEAPVVEEEKEWRPKSLTQKQLEELEEYDKKEKKKGQKLVVKPPELERKRWSFFDKFNFSPTTSRTETEFDIDTPPSTPPMSPVPAELVTEPPAKPKELKPLKQVEKFVTKPIVVKPPSPPPRDPTPVPPRPETPLPEFITQFKGQEWFEGFFPNVRPHMIPRPWSIEGFLQILLGLLQRKLAYDTKSHILAAILILYRQRPFTKEATIMAQESILTILDKSAGDVSRDEMEEKNRFIKLCLTLLTSFELLDEKYIIELMAQYITADIDPRQHVIHILHHDIGLQDPHDFLLRELDKFTTYGIFDSFTKKQDIKHQCKGWLDKWTGLVKKHITSLRGKIYRAKKGNVVRGTKSPNANVKGILKKDKDKEKTKEKDKEKTREKKEFAPNGNDKKISFMPNDFIDDAAENVGPVDAINYFCEVEYEKELERAREASVAPTEDTVKSDRIRNSVVLLPKIDGYRSLARLGETHKSCCHPERETLLAYDMRLPNFMNSKKDNFSRGLLLPLPPLTLNPFPNILDELLYEPFAHSQLVTLRTAPKYFVPARSYVHNLQI